MPEDETVNIGGIDFYVVHSYTLSDAINDGVLVPLFLDEGKYPADGKHVVATSNLLDAIGVEATLKVWDEFQVWKRDVMPTLPEEDQLYAPVVGEHELFIIEDSVSYCIMLRTDY